MRKVIAIHNGIFLCNDGTMWERKSKGYNGVYEWKQIDDIPQPDSKDRINSWHNNWAKYEYDVLAVSMKSEYE